MSNYMIPFTRDEIQNGQPIALPIDIPGGVIGISFVNSSAYFWNIRDIAGNIITIIDPNSKGNESFPSALSDKIIIERNLELPPNTSAAATNILYMRLNVNTATGAMQTDYSKTISTGAAQPVTLTNPLPAGDNVIGDIQIITALPSGGNTIGNVGIIGAVEIANDAGNPIPVVAIGAVEVTNDVGNPIPVSGRVNTIPIATTIETGTLVVNVAAVQLPAQVAIEGTVLIQAAGANTGIVFVGNAGGQDYELAAGQSFPFPVANLNNIYVRASLAAQNVNWVVGI